MSRFVPYSKFFPSVHYMFYQISQAEQCTKVHFASFFSSGFITAVVVNPPKRKLGKRTSVQCLERSQILGLWPQTCPTFSQFCLPALKKLENK